MHFMAVKICRIISLSNFTYSLQVVSQLTAEKKDRPLPRSRPRVLISDTRLWHLFHHNNCPNLTWEKKSHWPFLHFAALYTVSEKLKVKKKKECVHPGAFRQGCVRLALITKPQSSQTNALYGLKICRIIFLLNFTYSLQVVSQLLQRLRGNSYTYWYSY